MIESGQRPDLPSDDELAELLEWRPEHGVITVCLAADPGDRGVALTQLRNGLTDLERSGPVGREAHAGFRASAERILARFGDSNPPSPGELGVVEVAEGDSRELWWSSQAAPSSTAISFGERPLLAPLLEVAQAARARRVALLSGDRVRFLAWKPGRVVPEEEWEISLFIDDWRERKAPRNANPSRSQAVGSSGHDLFDERLENSRRQFLAECGRRVAASQSAADAPAELLVFGSDPHCQAFREAFGSGIDLVHAGTADLISSPDPELERTVASAVRETEAERQLALVQKAIDQEAAGGRGSAGLGATRAALERGQVEHLLLDASLPPAHSDPLIHAALRGRAAVTLAPGAAGELLALRDGVAALLRYSDPVRPSTA